MNLVSLSKTNKQFTIMLNGKFNYHKIMFTLEVLDTIEEKFAFLTHTRKQIADTIRCFDSEKPVNLRMYGDETILLEDNCEELQLFIQEMIKKYSPSIPDRRVPSNEQLKVLIKKEVQEYYKLERILKEYQKALENDKQVTSLEQEKEILEKSLKKIESPNSFNELPLNTEQKEKSASKPEVNVTSSIDDESTEFISKNFANENSKVEENKKKKNVIPNQTIPVNLNKKKESNKDDIIKDI